MAMVRMIQTILEQGGYRAIGIHPVRERSESFAPWPSSHPRQESSSLSTPQFRVPHQETASAAPLVSLRFSIRRRRQHVETEMFMRLQERIRHPATPPPGSPVSHVSQREIFYRSAPSRSQAKRAFEPFHSSAAPSYEWSAPAPGIQPAAAPPKEGSN